MLKTGFQGPYGVSFGVGIGSALSLIIALCVLLGCIALVAVFGALAVFLISAAALIGVPCLLILGSVGYLRWESEPTPRPGRDGYGDSMLDN